MKQFIFILCCLAIGSCSKNDKKIDPNRAIVFHGETATKAMSRQDSIHRVVEYCLNISWMENGFKTSFSLGTNDEYLETLAVKRDLVNDRIIFSGKNVLYESEWSGEIILGSFIKDTVSVRDIVFVGAIDSTTNELVDLRTTDWDNPPKIYWDTLGYIPNKTLIAAQKGIVQNFHAGNYEACYEIFDKAFVFKPITGPRWRALKAAGIE